MKQRKENGWFVYDTETTGQLYLVPSEEEALRLHGRPAIGTSRVVVTTDTYQFEEWGRDR